MHVTGIHTPAGWWCGGGGGGGGDSCCLRQAGRPAHHVLLLPAPGTVTFLLLAGLTHWARYCRLLRLQNFSHVCTWFSPGSSKLNHIVLSVSFKLLCVPLELRALQGFHEDFGKVLLFLGLKNTTDCIIHEPFIYIIKLLSSTYCDASPWEFGLIAQYHNICCVEPAQSLVEILKNGDRLFPMNSWRNLNFTSCFRISILKKVPETVRSVVKRVKLYLLKSWVCQCEQDYESMI